MNKLLWRTLTVLGAGLFLSSGISAQDMSPLLKGSVRTEKPKSIVVIYDFLGDVYQESFNTDANGKFSFFGSIPGEAVDAIVYIDMYPFGARLENGKTVVMNVDGDKAVFSGDNAKESAAFNVYEQAFNPMKFKPAGDEKFQFDEFKKRLDKGRGEIDAAISPLPSGVRSRYTTLANMHYNTILMQLLGMDQAYSKTDHRARIDSIAAAVDPNADEARLSGAINYWYNQSDLHRNGDSSSLCGYFAGQIAGIDSLLTNEGNKKNLWNTLGMMMAMYSPSEEELDEFFAAVKPQMDKAPKVKENIMETWKSMKPKVADGDAIPCDPILNAPDGNSCKLSDLLGDKVVYIDIWATWCRPCCAEIPYMEKVVADFRGNDKIIFLSLSRDDDHDAWIRKIKRDNPEWPQYIFDKASGDEFMNKMGITGIPRFLIVGRDGKLIAADAARPSDERIRDILNEAILK